MQLEIPPSFFRAVQSAALEHSENDVLKFRGTLPFDVDLTQASFLEPIVRFLGIFWHTIPCSIHLAQILHGLRMALSRSFFKPSGCCGLIFLHLTVGR